MEERDCDARKVECKPPTPLRRAVYELVHAQREPYMSTMSELNISKSDRWGWKNMFSFLFARIVSLSASHPSISALDTMKCMETCNACRGSQKANALKPQAPPMNAGPSGEIPRKYTRFFDIIVLVSSHTECCHKPFFRSSFALNKLFTRRSKLSIAVDSLEASRASCRLRLVVPHVWRPCLCRSIASFH